jgi:TetR/AcrR family transcriptional regulator, transcriptional repressor for nem operon
MIGHVESVVMGRVSDARERLMQAVSELIYSGSYGTTTIDQICERAGVKKGSFYYFFKSKADLAEAALEEGWKEHQAQLDKVFSATLPPVERFVQFCKMTRQEQAEMKKKHGYVLGCPLCTLGTEVSTQEQNLRKKVDSIMRNIRRYLETAIRDGVADGSFKVRDVQATSEMLFAYMEGLLTQARIQNNLDLFKGMHEGIFTILGAKERALIAA